MGVMMLEAIQQGEVVEHPHMEVMILEAIQQEKILPAMHPGLLNLP